MGRSDYKTFFHGLLTTFCPESGVLWQNRQSRAKIMTNSFRRHLSMPETMRQHSRSDQDPRRDPFRLPDAVSFAVRPKHPRQRGSRDGAKPACAVRGEARAIGHADARVPRRGRLAPPAVVLLEDTRGLAARPGIGEMDRARGTSPGEVDTVQVSLKLFPPGFGKGLASSPLPGISLPFAVDSMAACMMPGSIRSQSVHLAGALEHGGSAASGPPTSSGAASVPAPVSAASRQRTARRRGLAD